MAEISEPDKNSQHDTSLQSRRQIFFIMCITGFFAIFSSVMSKNPVLKPFANYLNTPSDWIGFVASVSSIPGIIASLPAASLSDIYGRRKILIFSAILFAFVPFCYLLITDWWQLILVRFFHGFATAVFVPTSEAYIAELFPDKRGVRISLFSSATSVGRAIAPTLGGFILSLSPNNFHNLYLLDGIVGCIALFLAIIFLIERQRTTDMKGQTQNIEKNTTQLATQLTFSLAMHIMVENWKKVAKNKPVLMVNIIQASQYYTFGAVEFFLTGYLIEIVEMDILLIGIIQTSIIIMLILIKPIMGKFGDRFGRRMLILGGLIIMVIPLIIIPFSSQFILLLILSMIYGCGFATVTAQTSPFVSELVSKDLVGTSMGFISTWMDVGQTLGTLITGLIVASISYIGGFISLAVILIGIGLIFFFSRVGSSKNLNK